MTPELFLDDKGEPLTFYDAVVGGRSVGTPGIPALMLTAHQRWGMLKWSDLFDDGVTLAQSGFPVSPRLALLVARDEKRLTQFETTANYFYPDGNAVDVGHLLKNPGYAQTLL